MVGVIDFHVQILRSYPLSSFDKRRRACSKVRSILTHVVIFSPFPSTLSEKKIRTRAFRTRERKISRSTSRQFPSSAYITHTISGYRSRLILATSLPWRAGAIHHTFFFIKLIFFKKSHLSLLSRGGAASSRSGTPGTKNSLGSRG